MANFQIKNLTNPALIKSFFWLTSMLVSLSLISLIIKQTATFMDRLDLFLTIVATIGLYGFAYSKKIASIVFWRYYFYFGLIETFIYTVALPMMGFERYEMPFVFNGHYILELSYAVVLLYFLYLYAYRSPSIWTDSVTDK